MCFGGEGREEVRGRRGGGERRAEENHGIGVDGVRRWYISLSWRSSSSSSSSTGLRRLARERYVV
jgi:hypothetical protein